MAPWEQARKIHEEQRNIIADAKRVNELTAENAKLRERADDIMEQLNDATGLLGGERQRREQANAENAKLREQLADTKDKLEETVDMLVNVYDLCNLDEEWAGKVAMVLAKNDVVTSDTQEINHDNTN